MHRARRRVGQLTTFARWGTYAVGMGVWGSGIGWLAFHYFFARQSEFGPSRHPLERWWLAIHGAFAFSSVWAFGWLWATHVTRTWPLRRRRWSGSGLVGVVAGLTLTGYLLYYVGNDTARSALSILHWALGLACPIPFLLHRVRIRSISQLPNHPITQLPNPDTFPAAWTSETSQPTCGESRR